jgi:hypothetical protein
MTGNVLIDEVELRLKSTICSPPACLPLSDARHVHRTVLDKMSTPIRPAA